MPTPVSRVPAAASAANAAAEAAPPDADVVAVHRPGQDPVGRRVEPVDELAALVVEVADDRRPAVGLDVTPEALVEVGLAAVGGHRQLAGERQAVEAEPVDELDLDVVPGDGHRRRSRRAPRSASRVRTASGRVERDLERDHAAERAADDEVEPVDAEGVEQPPLGPRLVAGRDRREGRAVRPARSRGSVEVGPVVP